MDSDHDMNHDMLATQEAVLHIIMLIGGLAIVPLGRFGHFATYCLGSFMLVLVTGETLGDEIMNTHMAQGSSLAGARQARVYVVWWMDVCVCVDGWMDCTSL
jgi:hypothetical protein